MKTLCTALAVTAVVAMTAEAHAARPGNGTSFNPATGVRCDWSNSIGTIRVPGRTSLNVTAPDCLAFSERCVASGGAPLNCRVICIGVYLDTDNDRVADIFLKADGQIKQLD